MDKKIDVQKVQIDGKTYVPEDTVPLVRKGNRHVVVVDRGWIFAGDVEQENGRLKLARAVHVLSWPSGGFAGLVKDPKVVGAKLFRLDSPVDIPLDSEIFRVPVDESWGL